MNVLSLFDGMSCGQIALNKANVKYDNYFASEIKKHAIKVTQHNFPNTIQLGDVTKINGLNLPKIDLLIGGSPCQDFSRANLIRDGLQGSKSMLFFEYVRLLKEVSPKYFLLENVIMDHTGYNAISEILNCEPVRINSSRTSGALRDRLYWTNIGESYYDLFGNRKCNIPQPVDKRIKLNDLLDYGYCDKYKHTCLNTHVGEKRAQDKMIKRFNNTGMTTLIYKDEKMNIKDGVRYINQNEMERLHNIPSGYTSILTERKAGDLIGDGWEVDTISHIFSFL